ncbi:MAG: ABC transporter permease [Bacilli bacterium]|nr:ABC transporter permease [Bacilli bacterium]
MNKKLWYLTRLSLNKKIKSKWFVVANIIILIVLIGILNIDYIIKLFGGDFDKFTNILVVDNTNYVYDDLENIYNESSKYIEDIKNSTITLSDKTTEELKEDLKDKDIILEINNDNDNFINAKVIVNGSVDTIIYQFITTSINQVKTNVALNSYGIDKDTMDLIEKSVDIEKININEDKKDDDLTNLALGVIFPIVILPVFLLVTYLVQMIGSEINEEKSTKSMEIIISNVSPEVHFLSKLISSNTFVLFQGLLMIIYSLFGGLLRLILSGGNVLSSNNEVLSEITDTISRLDILSKLSNAIPLTLILIIVTFIAYSLLSGILASMTTNMEDFQQLQTPIMVISLLGFYLSMASSMFDGSVFIRIMSYLPFISLFLSPALFLVGQITLVDVSISVLVMVVLIFLLYKYGLKIYKVGILNYSSSDLWKKIFKAIKS